MVNSRRKGADGEREVRDLLRAAGYSEARRGQQYCGANGDADVVGLPGIHIEVKRVQQLNVAKAIQQAINDRRDGEKACVFHRKDREPWLVTMPYEEWMELYKGWEKTNDNSGSL